MAAAYSLCVGASRISCGISGPTSSDLIGCSRADGMVGAGFAADVDVGADADDVVAAAAAGGGADSEGNDAEDVRGGDACLEDPNDGRAGARNRLGDVVGKADGSRGVSSLLIFLSLCHQTERGGAYIRGGRERIFRCCRVVSRKKS